MNDYFSEVDGLEQMYRDEEKRKKAMKKAAQPLAAGKSKLMYCASCQGPIVHQYQLMSNGSGGQWCCQGCKRKEERKSKVPLKKKKTRK